MLPSEKKRQRLIKISAKTNPNYGKSPKDITANELLRTGFINLDKPSGPTSHQVVAWIKEILEVEKAGHGGTLDPRVTGVLPVAIGDATRALQVLLHSGKEYVALMKLHRKIDQKKIIEVGKDFVKDIYQKPPVKSAVKRVRRKRKIYYLDMLQIKETEVLFKVGCEAGTYIRTLCVDYGKKLGSGAHLAELRRTKVGKIYESDSKTLQNLKDAYNQYKGGVVDKTDYMQATVSLNNAEAELKQDQGQLKISYANLKNQMGYPPNGDISLNYNMKKMEDEIGADTTAVLKYQDRIEYKLLQTQKRLQKANLDYYIWSFLPSLSAFGDYNLNYQNDKLTNLYNRGFPNSYVGLQLSFPIFHGGQRIQQIEQAQLELDLIKYDKSALESSISTEYTQALANYKSNLNNYRVQKNNLKLAKDVYNIIELQYKSGIKTYLDVITAETNLRTTQVNFLNALYQALLSKTDLQKALGSIHY